jgi:hypothetical protein
MSFPEILKNSKPQKSEQTKGEKQAVVKYT